MSDDRPLSRSAREIKQGLLKRAFEQGRGREMIAQILERTRRSNEIPAEHREVLDDMRRLQEELRSCIERTDFNKPEDPMLQAYIDEEEEREAQLKKDLINAGVPEDLIPPSSPAITRLNAMERMAGTNNTWTADGQAYERIRKVLGPLPSSPAIH